MYGKAANNQNSLPLPATYLGGADKTLLHQPAPLSPLSTYPLGSWGVGGGGGTGMLGGEGHPSKANIGRMHSTAQQT